MGCARLLGLLPQPIRARFCEAWRRGVVPSRSLTWPLKSYLPNRKVVFQPSFFRGYVSFREGKNIIKYSSSQNHGFVENGVRTEDVWLVSKWAIFHKNHDYGRKGSQGLLVVVTPCSIVVFPIIPKLGCAQKSL